MNQDTKNQVSLTVTGCLLAAGCAFSFGQRQAFFDAIGANSALEISLWVFLFGLMLGGIAKDLAGARHAILIGCIFLFIGAWGEFRVMSLYCLALGGGWTLATSNGLFEPSNEVEGGRWLNFTHAFYRGAGLLILLTSPAIEITKWLGFLCAFTAACWLYFFFTPVESTPRKAIAPRLSRSLVVVLISLNFLAGATELWSEKLFTSTALDLAHQYGYQLAGMMFLGRLAASTSWFSGPRQLFICSLVTSAAIFVFPLASDDWIPAIAMTGAFFSASIFPSLLGWVAAAGGRWRGTLCGLGQMTCMLAAPLAMAGSSYALLPGASLIIISGYMVWSPAVSQRLKHQSSDA